MRRRRMWWSAGRWWSGWSLRVVLLVAACLFPEDLALIEQAQGDLAEQSLVTGSRRLPDVAFCQRLEHPDGVDAEPGVQEPLDQTSDCHVPRGVTQFAVLSARADQPLLLPVAQDAWRHTDMVRQPGNGHQLFVTI